MNDAADQPKQQRRERYRPRYTHRAAVREFVLRRTDELGRGGVIQRVGSEIYVYLDAMIESELTALIRQHPSAFKTLQPYTPPKRS